MDNMKKKVYLFICLFFLIKLTGCNNGDGTSRNKDGDLLKIDVDPLKEDYTKTSELFDDSQIIKIETGENIVIGDIKKLIVFNNLYFLHDHRPKHALFCVNNAGKVLYKIQNIGRGPGEFQYISDFDIDEQKNAICIYDARLSKINFYDLITGEYMYEKTIDQVFASGFKINEETDRIYWYNDGDTYSPFNLIITDLEGNIIGEFLKYDGPKDLVAKATNFHEFNKNMYFYYGLTDTIFSITRDAVNPFIYINFGKHKIPKKYKKGSLKEIFSAIHDLDNSVGFITNFIENEKYIFFNYSRNFNMQMALYSKKNKVNKNIVKLKNDINGLPFPPPVKGLASPMELDNNGSIVCIYYPNILLDMYKEGLFDQIVQNNKRFSSLIHNLDYYDNPLIVKFKLKN